MKVRGHIVANQVFMYIKAEDNGCLTSETAHLDAPRPLVSKAIISGVAEFKRNDLEKVNVQRNTIFK